MNRDQTTSTPTLARAPRSRQFPRTAASSPIRRRSALEHDPGQPHARRGVRPTVTAPPATLPDFFRRP